MLSNERKETDEFRAETRRAGDRRSLGSIRIFQGMSLGAAVTACEAMGGHVERKHGGEVRFSHPLASRRRVTHAMRRSAPIVLVKWLRDLHGTLQTLRDWATEE